MTDRNYMVAAFYKFTDLSERDLVQLRRELLQLLRDHGIRGTILIANEGFNSTIAGFKDDLHCVLTELERIFGTTLEAKFSFHSEPPFQRTKVKIKQEIVTLGRSVDTSLGIGTHVDPEDWNDVITRDDVYVLDARNDYEYRTGTFAKAINPRTEKFSELPEFVESEFNPDDGRAIAMFCTGGIRCEKFAAYLKGKGFERVYQLRGGILNYLEQVPESEQLWQGECFVFDERVSVDHELRKGSSSDKSQAVRHTEPAISK
jgi:UPF0176 protein